MRFFVPSKIYQDKQIQVFLNKFNFTGKLEKNDDATMFFIAEKQLKHVLNFPLIYYL